MNDFIRTETLENVIMARMMGVKLSSMMAGKNRDRRLKS
jgi:hypothetical protein